MLQDVACSDLDHALLLSLKDAPVIPKLVSGLKIHIQGSKLVGVYHLDPKVQNYPDSCSLSQHVTGASYVLLKSSL